MKAPRHTETLTYRVVVTDKDGKVLHAISAPSKSFVRQWNQLINVAARGVDATVTDTDGVGRLVSTTWTQTMLNANAGIGDSDFGILVGKGSAAVTINDYALQTQLTEGVGVDQLNHQLMEFTVPETAGSTCSFKVRRSMINNSGATIVGVQELGVYVNFKTTTTYYKALAFRDVLGSAVDVPDGGAITVEYTIGVTV